MRLLNGSGFIFRPSRTTKDTYTQARSKITLEEWQFCTTSIYLIFLFDPVNRRLGECALKIIYAEVIWFHMHSLFHHSGWLRSKNKLVRFLTGNHRLNNIQFSFKTEFSLQQKSFLLPFTTDAHARKAIYDWSQYVRLCVYLKKIGSDGLNDSNNDCI